MKIPLISTPFNIEKVLLRIMRDLDYMAPVVIMIFHMSIVNMLQTGV